jgi:transposase, IS5 family
MPPRSGCSGEKLAKAGLIEMLFDRFDQHLAACVPVPMQRNSRDENEAMKAGRIPEEWDNKPEKLRQKDRDPRWTKRHGRSFFGYKNHVNADAMHKLIRRYEVTDAAVHDSQKLDELLTKGNTSADVFGDSAYRSSAIEDRLLHQNAGYVGDAAGREI